MILNTNPQNEAIMSNVGEIGEFRIRNSAKAFNILSSGLYANKIRAIIRELSCNAVDSHIAAGRANTPFDVHLPSSIEPWFSIRDYGTGLSHEQVTNIYTTYFESTKTASNEFIGALGLGSKSPFSYTDNFTVTAIKDGRKGIYTAFINDSSVPSIVLMMEEETTEPSGVEVKFSVTNYDYGKFLEEAKSHVYPYFKLKPVISGWSDLVIREFEYDTRDIVPGVHIRKDLYGSIAVMGNIAYPIDVPNKESNLGDLSRLLNGGLEIHFDIGELDFQASREGLSYIPQTIAAIKKKLQEVSDRLVTHLNEELDATPNLWEKAEILMNRSKMTIWSNIIDEWKKNNTLPTISPRHGYHGNVHRDEIRCDLLAEKFNISISRYEINYKKRLSFKSPSVVYNDSGYNKIKMQPIYYTTSSVFAIADVRGANERIKNHVHQNVDQFNGSDIYIIQPVDRKKPMDIDGFMNMIHNPPERCIKYASTFEKPVKPETVIGKNVPILKLVFDSEKTKWTEFKDTIDPNQTYYYVPLKGFQMISKYNANDIRNICTLVKNGLRIQKDIYGVRKSDLETIKASPNWINFEDFIADHLNNFSDAEINKMVKYRIDNVVRFSYNMGLIQKIKKNNDLVVLLKKYMGVEDQNYKSVDLEELCRLYGNDQNNVHAKIEKIVSECAAAYKRYPLLRYVSYSANENEVADYINLVDSVA